MRFHVLSLVACAGFLAACQPVAQTQTGGEARVVAVNGQVALGHWYSVNANCSARPVGVQVITPPKHGKVSTARTTEFPEFAPTAALAVCNDRRVGAITAVYTPDANFTGTDSTELKILFPGGDIWSPRYDIRVK